MICIALMLFVVLLHFNEAISLSFIFGFSLIHYGWNWNKLLTEKLDYDGIFQYFVFGLHWRVTVPSN